MIVPDLQTIIKETGGKHYSGVLHIGAHLGEEASQYVNAGIRYALWVEANPRLMSSLYDNVKFHPIRSQYLNVVLSNNNNDETVLNVTSNTEYSSVLQMGPFLTQNLDLKINSQIPVLTKRFDKVYRENNADIDLSKFDLLRVSTNGTELEVLKGFGNLLNVFPFRTICISNYDSSAFVNTSTIEEIDQFLTQIGFTQVLSTATDIKNELVYTKNT